MRAVTLEEIEEVVKGMAKNKSSGPDGFTKYLFQAFESFIARDIMDVVEKYLRTQKVHPRLNYTFI